MQITIHARTFHVKKKTKEKRFFPSRKIHKLTAIA